jgi:hypothetical protein
MLAMFLSSFPAASQAATGFCGVSVRVFIASKADVKPKCLFHGSILVMAVVPDMRYEVSFPSTVVVAAAVVFYHARSGIV